MGNCVKSESTKTDKSNDTKPKMEEIDKNAFITHGVRSIKETLHSSVYLVDKLRHNLESVGSGGDTPKSPKGDYFVDDKGEFYIKTGALYKNICMIYSLLSHTNDVMDNFENMCKYNGSTVEVSLKKVDIVRIAKEVHFSYVSVYENLNTIDLDLDCAIESLVVNLDEPKTRQILKNAYNSAIKRVHRGRIITRIFYKDSKIIIEIEDSSGSPVTTHPDPKADIEMQISKFIALRMMGGVSLNDVPSKTGKVFTFWVHDISGNSGSSTTTDIVGRNYFQKDDDDSIKNRVSRDTSRFSGVDLAFVEDDLINNEIMRTMLETMGFSPEKIINFYDGLEYENYINSHPGYSPQIVVLDIVLIKLHGDVLCKKLRDRGYTCPIIAVTGNLLTKDVIQKYVSMGFTEVLNKPYSIEKLEGVFGKYI